MSDKHNFLEKFDKDLKEKFFKDVADTLKLFGLKELKNFKLDLDYEDHECQDLILKFHKMTDSDRFNIVSKGGSAIVKRYFNLKKKKILLDRLDLINEKYIGRKEDLARAAHTASLLLEDKSFDSSHLPLLLIILYAELLEMEDEIFIDPDYFHNRAVKHLKDNDFEGAEKFFLLERAIDDKHWSSYEGMADVYYKQGIKDKACKSINKALDLMYDCWRSEPEFIDYEVVEEVEEKADLILERDRSVYIKRLCGYARGLLYFFGASYIDTIKTEIGEVSGCKKDFSKEEFIYYIHEEPGVVLDEDIIYLKGVEDPSLILSEVEKRSLKQISMYSLSGLQLAAEGRLCELFFDRYEGVEELDRDIKRLTKGEFDFISVYEELRKDVVGRDHHDLLLNKIISKKDPRMTDSMPKILNYIWNTFPRWELAGRSSVNLMDKKRKNKRGDMIPPKIDKYFTSFAAENEDAPLSHQFHQHHASKIGRNDPCPCGSGKKYKKCCGFMAN